MSSQISRNRVFNMPDKIENRVGLMAHEIPELSEQLKLWQDFKIKDYQFIETLNKYIDQLNKG